MKRVLRDARVPFSFPGSPVGRESKLCIRAIAIAHRSGLTVGARTLPGKPYDGRVLSAQLEQTDILLEDVGRTPKQVVVDLSYRGVAAENPGVEIIHRGRCKAFGCERIANTRSGLTTLRSPAQTPPVGVTTRTAIAAGDAHSPDSYARHIRKFGAAA